METETNHPIQESNIPFSNSKKHFIAMLIFLIPVAVLLLTYPSANERGRNENDSIVKIEKPFPDVDISAKSVYVWDAANKKAIFAKNERSQLPLASLAKVMAALVALDEIDGSAKVKITSDSIRQEGDSGLAKEERWKLKDLIDFSLVTSSNDGIYAVASAIENDGLSDISLEAKVNSETQPDAKQTRENFIDLMNKKAGDISLNNTFYLNETGLDSSDEENGGYGTAEDMAKLFAYIIKNNPEVLEATSYDEIELTSLDQVNHIAQNTNAIVRYIPNLIASKTGYTDLSGGNLVVAFDLGLMRPIVISVLGSTREGRFEDMKKLIEATTKYLADENEK